MKNQLLFLAILLSILTFSCENQPEKVGQKSKKPPPEKLTVEEIYNPNLSIVEDDYTLADSASFYEMVNYMINRAERNGGHHELTDGSISYKVYKMVYETPDSEISLNRKLDLLSLMFFYHYHAANEYNAKVNGQIVRANKNVLSRPVLLVPVLKCEYWSESVLYTITGSETIELPKSYVPTMEKTIVEINKLLTLRKATESSFGAPITPLFDKKFFTRYPKHHIR